MSALAVVLYYLSFVLLGLLFGYLTSNDRRRRRERRRRGAPTRTDGPALERRRVVSAAAYDQRWIAGIGNVITADGAQVIADFGSRHDLAERMAREHNAALEREHYYDD